MGGAYRDDRELGRFASGFGCSAAAPWCQGPHRRPLTPRSLLRLSLSSAATSL